LAEFHEVLRLLTLYTIGDDLWTYSVVSACGGCKALPLIGMEWNSIYHATVLQFLTSTPNLPSQASHSTSAIKQNLGERIMKKARDNNPCYLYTRLILDVCEALG